MYTFNDKKKKKLKNLFVFFNIQQIIRLKTPNI